MINLSNPVLILLLSSATLLSGQSIRKPGDFEALNIIGNFEVVLVKGSENSIEIEEDEEGEVRIEWQGDQLRIKRTKLYDWTKYDESQSIRLRVTYSRLQALKAAAGAKILCADTIKIEDLILRFSSGANGKLDIRTETVRINVSEGANLYLRGQTKKQEVSVATGGEYYGYKLDADRTYIKASTGSIAEVVALEKIDARAHTGGEIQYKGSPQRVSVSDHLGGEVRDY